MAHAPRRLRQHVLRLLLQLGDPQMITETEISARHQDIRRIVLVTLSIGAILALCGSGVFDPEPEGVRLVKQQAKELKAQADKEEVDALMRESYFEHRRECIQLARKVYGNGNLDQLEILGDQLLEAHPELHQVKARPTEAQPYVPTYVPTVKPEMNASDKKFVKDSLANLGF